MGNYSSLDPLLAIIFTAAVVVALVRGETGKYVLSKRTENPFGFWSWVALYGIGASAFAAKTIWHLVYS